MKGALVSGLIAQVKGEALSVGDLAGDGVEAGCLERDGAGAEPVVLCHVLDERFFRGCGRPVLGTKAGEEFIEIGLRFGGEDLEGARGREAMAGVVARGGGFAGFRFGAGRELRIRAVSGYLR